MFVFSSLSSHTHTHTALSVDMASAVAGAYRGLLACLAFTNVFPATLCARRHFEHLCACVCVGVVIERSPLLGLACVTMAPWLLLQHTQTHRVPWSRWSWAVGWPVGIFSCFCFSPFSIHCREQRKKGSLARVLPTLYRKCAQYVRGKGLGWWWCT